MLHYNNWDATCELCPMLHRFENILLYVNNSPYLNGYHGYQHMLYALNTFHFLQGHLPYGIKNLLGENLIHHTAIAALMWHDCNYCNPFNDKENTEVAIQSLEVAEKEFNRSDSLDFGKIRQYISDLIFPFTAPPIDDIAKILRDCDLSMILYDDYFKKGGLFQKLINHEFSTLSENQLIDRCSHYIDNLSYYNHELQSMLDEIGKETLYEKVKNMIIYN